ncbi:hypothetical protein K3X48_04170 [Aliiroseovarius crassostreae]|uniref:Prepilin-type N-terminal cleavage/methylation domain-containing protein n=1 Tax=Aliiroseovarius crassostreae TaxID=154981 RepID=A0A9Q9HCV4_9RHOB|nr:hypothetical protein [Aliiroseovarius crassostreae]UWP96192.1 hypothetical protein K3X48_04170 [Aliiroseovarius crassostreae]
MRNKQKGLTQLELLISLTIMGLLAILLANALNFSSKLLSKGRITSGWTEQLLAQDTLRRLVETIPLDLKGAPATEVFSGTPERFKFVSSSKHYRVSVFHDDQTSILVLKSRSNDGTSTETTLGSQITNVQMNYFGKRSDQPEPQWHPSWSDPKNFPDLVKLEWETLDGHPLPPLTFQPAKSERHNVMSLSSLLPPG